MDSGVDLNHLDLKDRWRGGTNSWFDPNGQHDLPADISRAGMNSSGHGTGVMGIIVGGSAGGTSIGAAPGAKWIAVKIFNDEGIADFAGIHEGYQWLLDPDGNPDTDDAPDIINNSWGLIGVLDQCAGESGYDEFHADIQVLKDAGIAVLFSAGNDGPGPATSISPANDAESFSVGAVDEFDLVTSFSSRGPSGCGSIYPHVVAPGVNIKTADLTFGGLFPNSYASVTGSSYAASHGSGVMALLASAFPDATPYELEEALTGSALDLGILGPDNDYGYGRIDAVAAYNYLQALGFVPCVRPDVHFDADPLPGFIGEPIQFTSVVTGGTPPYSYAWDINGDGMMDSTAPSITHSYATLYDGSVSLTVTDSTGCSSSLFVAESWAVCTPMTVNFTVDPNPAKVGETVSFESTVLGGTPPFSYSWDLDDDGFSDCSDPDCFYTYTTAFDGEVELMVTDSRGCRALPELKPLTVDPVAGVTSTSGESTSSGNGSEGGGGGGCFISALVED
jgi:PKD repeat protein